MNKIDPTIDLIKHEKKLLRWKITHLAKKKILRLHHEKNHTKSEIAGIANLQPSRITEILYPEEYEKMLPISENTIINLIIGGILSTKDIREECDLSEKEKNYLKKFDLFDEKIKKQIRMAAEKGVTVEELNEAIENLIKKHRSGE